MTKENNELKWTSVEDGLPDEAEYVLVTDGDGLFWVTAISPSSDPEEESVFHGVIWIGCDPRYNEDSIKYWAYIPFDPENPTIKEEE